MRRLQKVRKRQKSPRLLIKEVPDRGPNGSVLNNLAQSQRLRGAVGIGRVVSYFFEFTLD